MPQPSPLTPEKYRAMRERLGSRQSCAFALGVSEATLEMRETGKRAIFYGGGFMRRVVGLTSRESDAVLRMVREQVENPDFHCRWNWQVGDMAIWDERSTIHRALGDHFPRKREVRRCVVDGDRPFFDGSIAA